MPHSPSIGPLEEIGEAIWLAEGDIVSFYGFPYPTRTVVVRLESGGLWVWSPTKLTAGLADAIDRLGPVAHLVSPNKIHHLYLQDWKARYPAADIWGPQTVIKKRRDLAFREPLTDTPPAAWQADLDQAWFRGSPAMDEIVFLHRSSRTVIVADLIENFAPGFLQEHWSWWQRPLSPNSMASQRRGPAHRANGVCRSSIAQRHAGRATRF